MDKGTLTQSSWEQLTKKSELGFCRSCGKKTRWISQNGNCKDCIKTKVLEPGVQIRLRRGPIYEKYKKNMMRRFGVEV